MSARFVVLRHLLPVVIAVLGITSLPHPAGAQQASGIAGIVRDITGAVLPGVTVEASSPALIEKARTVVTDSEGRYNVVDMRPGDQPALAKAFGRADVVVVPTRVGGVETPSATAVLDLVPDGLPFGIVICAARTFTRDYHEALASWEDEDVPVWGTVPERVAIAAGPDGWLAPSGLEAYRDVWRVCERLGRTRPD